MTRRWTVFKRHEDDVVLIGAEAGGALGLEHADDLAGDLLQSDGGTERIGLAEQRRPGGLAEDADGGARLQFRVGERTAIDHRPVARIEEAIVGAGDAHGVVEVAVDRRHLGAGSRRHHAHALDLGSRSPRRRCWLKFLGVGAGDVRPRPALPGPHHQQIRAKLGDVCWSPEPSCPAPSVTMAITAATPMTMPSTVRNERSALRMIVLSDSLRVSASMSGSLRRRPVMGDVAVEEMDDAVRVGRHIGLVGDHGDGDAGVAVERGEQFHDVAAGRRVEVAGRLVGEDDLRAGDDGPRDGDTLLLAAGKLVGIVAGAVGKADLGERLERQTPPLGRRHAAIDQRQLDILDRRGARQQVEALEDEAEEMTADPRLMAGVEVADADAVEGIGAGGRPVEAAQDVHRRRLARAAGPHDGDELAARNGEVDAFQRR